MNDAISRLILGQVRWHTITIRSEISWNYFVLPPSLLNYVVLSDEVTQLMSWLTAAVGHSNTAIPIPPTAISRRFT
jgi:hypothetical protein